MIHIIKKKGKFYKLMIFLFAIMLIQFVYAGTVKITSPTTPQNYSVNVNSTCYVNINNSDLLDGFHASYFYPYSNPYNFINTTGDTWSTNYTSYYNKTQLDNGTWIKNNTSPTFVNVTATTGILSLIYDLAGILTIDINNHLLYDLASVLSLDFNDRVLYASDGIDKILDWYNVGIADFGNTNITTTGNVTASFYCNSTNCYNVNDFLIDTTGDGADSWAGNYTLYYNKTLIDHNFTFYYLKTEVDNNLTLYYLKTEIDNNFSLYLPLTGGTLSGNLTLPSINITTNYVCNSTNCYTINDFLINEGSSYNVTYANYVIANISNMSYFWNNLASSSDIVIGDLTPSNLDLTGYALAVTYINGSFGVLNMKAEDWILEGVDLVIDRDLYIGGTLYPNATLSRDIGSGALRWNILWVSNISSENIDNSGKITSGTYCNSTGTCRDLSAWGTDVDLTGYAKYQFTNNNFNGSGNFTTTGMGQFAWTDLLAQASNPSNPPSYTLRLFVKNVSGYGIYQYLDSGGMVRQTSDQVFVVFNNIGSTIPALSCVYSTGNYNNLTIVGLAKANSLTTMPCIGVTIEAIANGTSGRIMQNGILQNVDLSGLTSGSIAYVSDTVAGGFRFTPPITPNLTQSMGIINIPDSSGQAQVILGTLKGNEFGTINSFTALGNLTSISGYFCNSTNCYNINDFLSTTGDGSFNTTYHNYVVANISNQSYNWITSNNLTMNGINTTQMRNVNGYLTIVENWWDGLYCKLTGCTMTGNLNFSNSNITNPSYIIMKETNGACDLTINHSWCSNITGSYFVG